MNCALFMYPKYPTAIKMKKTGTIDLHINKVYKENMKQ